MRFIFDLDGTVIDSNHRKATLPDGTLDLAHWVRNNTPDKIAADSLLPLASVMRAAWNKKRTVLICTARVMGRADFRFLKHNRLKYSAILHRPQGCTMGDADLKDIQLRLYAQRLGISWKRFCAGSVMFDDAPIILERMASIGIDCVDAAKWNNAKCFRKAAA